MNTMSRLEVAKSLRDAWPYVVCQENENGDSSAWLYKANGKLILLRKSIRISRSILLKN